MKMKQAILNFYLASKGKQDSNIYYEQMGSTINAEFVAPLLIDGTESNVLLTIDKKSLWDDYVWDIVCLIEKMFPNYDIETEPFPTAYWPWQRKMVSMIFKW